MDLFAVVLVTLTILTIFGIFLFIFVCSLQPKIVRHFHRKKNKTYYITASKKQNEIDGDLHINNLDLTNRSLSIDHDKRTYLKILERSVRTGRRIQYEKDNNNIKNKSHSGSFYFLRRYINKHLSSTTTTTNI